MPRVVEAVVLWFDLSFILVVLRFLYSCSGYPVIKFDLRSSIILFLLHSYFTEREDRSI
jgi:hypothetical protein